MGPNLGTWIDFKIRFVSRDGRVIDTGNKGVSHSEGQGWGLFAAVFFNDQPTFDSLLSWTTRELQRKTDLLHSWRYIPGAAIAVADRNNATDGDLFIAAALARAAVQWKRQDLQRRAEGIVRDILRLLVRRSGARTVLLPSASGFTSLHEVILNPSYYVFPILRELEQLVSSPLWRMLERDALELLSNGRFGHWMLPPDWLSVSNRGDLLAPAVGWPPRFSYDAIRIPLFLSWARLSLPPMTEAFKGYWNSFAGSPPAWVNLTTGQTASYNASAGMLDVAAFSMGLRSSAGSSQRDRASADYYSSGLTLLTEIARQETDQI